MLRDIPSTAGVVLDLDDTLYSERSFHDSGFVWIAQRAGLNPHGTAVRRARAALRQRGRPLDVLSDATGIPVQTLLEWHRDHPPQIGLYPDARRFLARLSEARIPAVLLTDGRSTTQRAKIAALGVSGDFVDVLISEETGVDKFDPAAFESAAKCLPGREDLFYFGDNPDKDAVHPVVLGWNVFLRRDAGDNVHPQSDGAGDGDGDGDGENRGAEYFSSFDEFAIAGVK